VKSVTLVPYISCAGELKTKPTQHSVNKLREIGIQPDVLICRTDRPIDQSLKSKIALFCNVDKDAVISAIDVASVYEVPLIFRQEGLDEKISKTLNIWARSPKLDEWERIAKKLHSLAHEVRIGIAGKYVNVQDSYKSLHEALIHGGLSNNSSVSFKYIDSEDIEKKGAEALLSDCDAVLVPGGFGDRGIEGKISAIRYAREKKKPFLGICLGMQLSVVEIARDMAGLSGANSAEFDPNTPYPVIHIMESQKGIDKKGGTMRLGAYPCVIKKGSKASKIYGTLDISERHRHRYEVNTKFRPKLEKAGLVFSGQSPDGALMEIIEYPNHPWFVGCQFHPEFKSRPVSPHPLFRDFVRAALHEKTAPKKGKKKK